ncbi:Oidioi.mRNA.OKI2018_I69.PAR.g11731.t1.cds [Oikopleura dioica]|uniref:Oidioi.mRNA.OKI2018_I69.PAR.g11731.t1.cds n=1 Tax=Oikopleura dioica TaxID=34765 RepID=A0ABN7S1U3_OIKDI|nr:Oidioi.mRNA.OKI2018_I69.PAR.g11731.t1.cds [Oikopleura dioica]
MRPLWLAHVQHAGVFIASLLEAYNFSHSKCWPDRIPGQILSAVYSTWITSIYHVTGRWPYPYFPTTKWFLLNFLIVETAGSLFTAMYFSFFLFLEKVILKLRLKLSLGINL